MRFVYLILAVVGLVLPYSFFLSFLAANGLNFGLFFKELLATKISTFFAADLLLSCVVFLRYVRPEATRYHVRHWWLYLVATLTVGLSFAFPLFLYVREARVEQAGQNRRS